MQIRGLLFAVVVLAAACASRGRAPEGPAEGWTKNIIAYKKVVSLDHGLAGYIKVYRYEKPEGGPHFDLYHVYDLNFRERGIITPQGRATKYVYLPSEVARVKGTEFEKVELPSQTLQVNAAKILELPPGVEIVDATAADLSVGR